MLSRIHYSLELTQFTLSIWSATTSIVRQTVYSIFIKRRGGGQSPQGVQPPQGGGQSPQGGGQSPQGGQSPAPTEKKRKKRKNRTSRSEGWNCCKNDWQFFTAGEGFAIRKKHLSQVISELSAIHKMLVSEKFAQSMQTKKREEILKLTSEIVKTSKQIIYEGTPKTTPQPTRERSLRIQASPHK